MHPEALADSGEEALQLIERDALFGSEVHAHEEASVGGIAELGTVDDVALLLEQERSYGGDDALLIGTSSVRMKRPVGRFEAGALRTATGPGW